MAKSPTPAPVAAKPTDGEEIVAATESKAPVVQAPAPAPEPNPAPAAPQPEPVVRIGVQEFCTRELDSDPRAYAGLYAFQKREESEGRVLDTVKAFGDRYKAMMNSPSKR